MPGKKRKAVPLYTGCRNPSISMVAWEQRQPGSFIFVKVPNERGRYLRTDLCVSLVPCPHCESVVGEPCANAPRYHGNIPRYTGSTHHLRRSAARTKFGNHYGARKAHDVIKKRQEYTYA